jgi:hypothetical protein
MDGWEVSSLEAAALSAASVGTAASDYFIIKGIINIII